VAIETFWQGKNQAPKTPFFFDVLQNQTGYFGKNREQIFQTIAETPLVTCCRR
jgi:hypothetical protein